MTETEVSTVLPETTEKTGSWDKKVGSKYAARQEPPYKCCNCGGLLTDANWSASQQKYNRYVCRPCWASRQQLYAAEKEQKEPGTLKKWRDRTKQTRKAWSPERKEQERLKQYARHLGKAFGISLEEYDSLLKSQGGRCAICFRDEPTGKGYFHVDHDHKTGQIRSLLCSKCNFMIGMAGDQAKVLRRAADYIGAHRFVAPNRLLSLEKLDDAY